MLDGHGGPEAAAYVRERLWPILQGHPGFVSENAEDVADAIRESFALVHDEMKKQALPTWPIRPDGHPSTAGTTVSVLLIRAKRYWIANVGDSRVVVSKGSRAVELTTDHRLTNERERASLERRGGMVVKSSQGGILRVVWQRTVLNNPRMIERLPFLNMTRALGDYWSMHPGSRSYAVSPDPDGWSNDMFLLRFQFTFLRSLLA